LTLHEAADVTRSPFATTQALCKHKSQLRVFILRIAGDAVRYNLVLISDITHICLLKFHSVFNKDQFYTWSRFNALKRLSSAFLP